MKTYLHLVCLAVITISSFSLSSCNNSDDVGEIFLDKTWKLTKILADQNPPQEVYDYWDSEEARKKSLELLFEKGTFVISFSGFVKNNKIDDGGYSGRATTSEISGKWTVDGDSRVFSTTQTEINDGDPLGRAFIKALSLADKYGGDSQNLQIFFTEGGKRRYLLFRVDNAE